VPLLTYLRAPTLVVCGEMDQATPPALNRQVAEHVKEACDTELPAARAAGGFPRRHQRVHRTLTAGSFLQILIKGAV
jgi:hypothetical protein